MKNDFNQMENLLKLSGEQIFIQIFVLNLTILDKGFMKIFLAFRTVVDFLC